jgi:hypothetical protein
MPMPKSVNPLKRFADIPFSGKGKDERASKKRHRPFILGGARAGN